jgi:hypothetical protein
LESICSVFGFYIVWDVKNFVLTKKETMKKALLFLMLLGLNLSIFAQSFNFGLKLGTNYGNLSISKWEGSGDAVFIHNDITHKMGLDFGAFARLEGRRFFLQPELIYAVKNSGNNIFIGFRDGQGGIFDDQGVVDHLDFKLESLQIPFLMGCKIIKLPDGSINIFAGPALNFQLATNSWVNGDYYREAPFFQKQIWDWQAGAGLDAGKFVIDLRYEWGISNACDINKTSLKFNSRFQTLTLTIGVKFL